MHTKVYDKVRFTHEGDYSGNVHIVHDVGLTNPVSSATIPVSALVAFVADVVRQHKMKKLEDASAEELFGLKGV